MEKSDERKRNRVLLVIMDERILLDEARKGNLESFNCLVLAYQNQAFSLAYRILGEVEAAADAAQQAFISAFRHLGDLRGESFRSWLLRIVANACMDELRRRKRRPSVSLEELSGDEEGGNREETLRVLADPAEGPEAAAIRADLRAGLEECLSRLTPDARATILLADVHALDYADVARALRIALGTVKSRIARARADLRECLQAKGEHPFRARRQKEEARA